MKFFTPIAIPVTFACLSLAASLVHAEPKTTLNHDTKQENFSKIDEFRILVETANTGLGDDLSSSNEQSKEIYNLNDEQSIPPLNAEELEASKEKCLKITTRKEMSGCYAKHIIKQLALITKHQHPKIILSRYCSLIKKETNLEELTSDVMGLVLNRNGTKSCKSPCIWKDASEQQKKELIMALHSNLSSKLLTIFRPLAPYPFELSRVTKKRVSMNTVHFQVNVNYQNKDGSSFKFTSTTAPLKLYDITHSYLNIGIRSQYRKAMLIAYKQMKGSKEEKVSQIIKKILNESEPTRVTPLFEIKNQWRGSLLVYMPTEELSKADKFSLSDYESLKILKDYAATANKRIVQCSEFEDNKDEEGNPSSSE